MRPHIRHGRENLAPLLWNIQPYEVHNGSQYTDAPARFGAFESGEPYKLDVLNYFEEPVAGIDRIRVWEVRESSVGDGMVEFINPLISKWEKSMLDHGTTVLELLRESANTWWGTVLRKVVHFDATEKLFDGRAAASSRNHLQCCLVLAKLFSRGLPRLASAKSVAYYRMALKHPEKALECIAFSANACTSIIKKRRWWFEF